jgi:putative flippase GtrA
MADRDSDDTEDGEPQLVASDLDELTHQELGLIYADTTRAILFAKDIQWKSVASTLVLYGALIVLAKYVSHGAQYMMVLKISAIALAMVATFLVVLFQFWQHTEARKLVTGESAFSNLFRRIRKFKSKRQADIHRYIILAFMVGIIVLGCGIALMSLDAITR